MADKQMRARLARAAARLNAASAHAGCLPPLILMTDDERLPDPLAATRALPRGSLVIVRARDNGRRARLAEDLKAIARARDLFVLIAGDPHLAMRCGGDGLHLPETHAPEAAHWRARFPHWLITCAAHDMPSIVRARVSRADAVLLSPVFTTRSHPGAATLGAARFRALTRAANIAVYALGGIDARNAQRLAGSGTAGIAAIGALSA